MNQDDMIFEKEDAPSLEEVAFAENEQNSLKELSEYQNNAFNPGHYIGTGRIPPMVSATGNPLPLAIVAFIAALLFLAFGLFSVFGDDSITPEIKPAITGKLAVAIVFLGLTSFCVLLGFRYVKKAKKYYKEKAALKNQPIDDSVEDKIWQRTCPNCNKQHDVDYPKCPFCNYNYAE